MREVFMKKKSRNPRAAECITKLKNSVVEGFSDRLDQRGERISELEDRAVELIQLDEQKE